MTGSAETTTAHPASEVSATMEASSTPAVACCPSSISEGDRCDAD
jgi:hypothetical protein